MHGGRPRGAGARGRWPTRCPASRSATWCSATARAPAGTSPGSPRWPPGLPVDVPGLTVDRQCGSGLAAVDVACALLRVRRRGACSPAASSPPPPRRCGSGPETPPVATSGRRSRRRRRRPGHGARRRRAGREGRRVAGSARTPTPPARTRWPSRTRDAGGFDAEVVPVGRRDPRRAAPRRPDRRAAGPAAAGVPPAADGGTVTAGNSCGVNDGAAAVALVDAATHRPARCARAAGAGHRHRRRRPAPARPRPGARRRAGARPRRPRGSATSTWSSSTRRSPGRCWPAATRSRWTPTRVCVEGGALALGHPWGASGAVLVVRLFSQLVAGRPRALRAGGDRRRRRPGRRDGGRAMPVIEARGVSHRYGEHAGARTVLPTSTCGSPSSGSASSAPTAPGKSTFARMLNGLVLPTAGTGHASTGSTPARDGPRGPPPGRLLLHRPRRADRDADGGRGRRVRAAPARAVQAGGRARGSTPRWRRTGWPGTPTTPRTCSPAGRSSCSRWRRCWSPSRTCW